jgi:hypothetical protein
MYAVKTINEIYHLVQRGGRHTLCGLRISRVSSDQNMAMLQIVDEVSVEKKICKHCERISKHDSL